MAEQDNIELKINQRGSELVEVENLYLDGEYDRESIKRRIEQSKAIIGQQIYFMGRDLIMLKERCEHGEFVDDLIELGVAKSTAHRYMTIAVKYNSPKLQKLVNSLSGEKGVFSKLLELSTEVDEDLEDLVDGGTVAGLKLDDIDRMSAKELRESLRKAHKSAEQEKETNEQMLIDKNHKADELAKKLSVAQGIPEKDRWTEQVAVYRKELTAYGLDAEELINTVNNIVLSLQDVDAPDSAKQSMAIHTKDLVNTLISACGQLSNSVYDQLGFYINQPTYSISDELTLIDEEQEAS